MSRTGILICATLAVRTAHASPNVSLDHPAYDQLAALEALGRIAPPLGGFLPLTEARIEMLLGSGSVVERGRPLQELAWWVSPIHRLAVHTSLFRDRPRPYSTLLRPRDIAGALTLSCERNQGMPCGDGAGLVTDLESAAGYGAWLSASMSVRTVVGTDDRDSDITVDRAYLSAEVGPVAAEVGRDAFALGPSSRTQLAWGTNAPPLDHVRITTAHPWQLTPSLRVDGQYILGRLRAPQRYPGTLVSIMRGQIEITDTIDIGLLQMLQLGGDGARELGFVDFLLEHVRRADASAGETDSSNRRFGGDVTARIRELQGLRLYYAVVFEDIRRARLIDAIRYDADHLVGAELAAIGPGHHYGITLEWHKTGVRSQEHGARTTGFTNAERVVGSPLGPDGESLYLGARVELPVTTLFPWLELARSASDTYQFIDHGPIQRTGTFEDEARYRAGLRARVPGPQGLTFETSIVLERVDDLEFVTGAARTNVGISASMIWYPPGRLGRLASN